MVEKLRKENKELKKELEQKDKRIKELEKAIEMSLEVDGIIEKINESKGK